MMEALNYYRNELKKTPEAIEYLKRRGLSGEIAARYGLGYAPDAWQSLKGVSPITSGRSQGHGPRHRLRAGRGGRRRAGEEVAALRPLSRPR